MASRLTREPADIVLLLDGRPLGEEMYNRSFQDVYPNQNYTEYKGKPHLLIDYHFNSYIPPIRMHLLNKFGNLINIVPNTIALLRGIDVISEDWN
jgi:hypothetical protein